MKELTIEQKAQRYDEAIERVNAAYKDEDRHLKATLERIFPELKESEESEDEKIREELISNLKETIENIRSEEIIPHNAKVLVGKMQKWIAWLEKQVGQNNNEDADILQRFSFYSYKDEPNILYLSGIYVNEDYRNKGIGTKILKVADEVATSIKCNSIRLKTEKDSHAEKLYRENGYTTILGEEENQIWLEKQGEQKPNNEEMKVLLQTEYEKGRADAIAEMQKPWSEEDEAKLKSILFHIEDVENKDVINWLKSLKDRVQPQPKQDWSQNDIDMIDWLIRCCEDEHKELCNDKYGHQDIVSDLKRDCRKKWDWLESLKNRVVPQKQWKPSEEYILVVESCMKEFDEGSIKWNLLKELLEQLKQL